MLLQVVKTMYKERRRRERKRQREEEKDREGDREREGARERETVQPPNLTHPNPTQRKYKKVGS